MQGDVKRRRLPIGRSDPARGRDLRESGEPPPSPSDVDADRSLSPVPVTQLRHDTLQARVDSATYAWNRHLLVCGACRSGTRGLCEEAIYLAEDVAAYRIALEAFERRPVRQNLVGRGRRRAR